MGYLYTVLTTLMINSIAVLGLNIILGYAGQISLGHAAFMGIGAYASALLSTKAGFPFWFSFPLAVLISAVIGFLLGLPSLRVRDDFLAITTIGINFIVQAIFLYVPFFGAALGIGGIPKPRIGEFVFRGGYYSLIVLIVLLVGIILSFKFYRSWAGLASETIREDELAANVIGINPVRFKLMAFVLGSAYAGASGALYAHFMGFISSDDFSFPLSVTFLSMLVFGGVGTIKGSIIGAFFLGALPEILRPLAQYRLLFYGFLLLLMLRFCPGGLASLIRLRK
ncbi:MAG: branched-chain amino acid ABC transporter permease [Synergistetes bacterium]|nr:branched-chain amino acid ABC transporter permease [Synergistota bacterium]MDW8191902.1 branched-chain amino acid ABC transporter permease [Synergistota bacterium]